MTTADVLAEVAKPTHDPMTREFEYGGHVFVWARPRHKPWRHYDGTTNSLRHQEYEFRPCMLSGHDSGRRLVIIGSTYSHQIEDFEIGEDAERV